MNTESPFVITISRELGSGGRSIGEKLAGKLGVRYCDKLLIRSLVSQFNLTTYEIEKTKAKKKNWLADFIEKVAPVPRADMILGPRPGQEGTPFPHFTTSEEIFAAEQWFAMDSLQLAMKGNAMHMGFEAIADEYGSTKAGNRAKYCAGIICLRQGEYQRAIDYLESCKLKDDFTPILAKVLIGDAYYELDNVKEAVNYYEKAAKMDDNEITAPYALFKAGMAYMKLGDNAKANEAFTQIKEKYPFSTEARQIDKYIGAAEQLAEE